MPALHPLLPEEDVAPETTKPEPAALTGIARFPPSLRPTDLRLKLSVVAVMATATSLRLWNLGAVGFNSDEAVYAGQAAGLLGDADLAPYFPVFRAHPMLFQMLLSIVYIPGVNDEAGRALSAVFGVATVWFAYRIGCLLYGRRTGVLTALFLALMPYHVVVTRQVLLDGPEAFFATLTLYALIRYSLSSRPVWLYATAGAMGLTFLSKETAILFVSSIYAYLALSRDVHVRAKHIVGAGVLFAVIAMPFPATVMFSGKKDTGHSFLAWQLFRPANHSLGFYLDTVPAAMGILVVAVALAGLWLYRAKWSWRERLLCAWIVMPTVFFTLWPVKGFQYLLPLVVPVAVLAARVLADEDGRLRGAMARFGRWGRLGPIVLVAIVSTSLLVPSWSKIQPSTTGTFLAGSGGVAGGRETGEWVAENVPAGAKILAMGPSMANILQFYGGRKAYGLSVSPNPLHRNPAYEPVPNPDLQIRRNEIQYIVWDSYSAGRSAFFEARLQRYVDRYHGRAVHTETVTVVTDSGERVEKPVIIVYAVRP